MNVRDHLHLETQSLVHAATSSQHVKNFHVCPGRTCLQMAWTPAQPLPAQPAPSSVVPQLPAWRQGWILFPGWVMVAEPSSPESLLVTETMGLGRPDPAASRKAPKTQLLPQED